ncbi:MAG: undecaprenyl-diphosphatase, partial [Negativicutes bacterium]|nr:undecaprenyl-diphosphatase [Negativicutes bacterium]
LLSETEWAILAVGTIVAFVVSLLAIRFLMRYIQKNDFSVFGWYRIVLGIAVLVYFGLLA